MNLREKELIANNPIHLFHDDLHTINGVTYKLDMADQYGNSPPIGWLWARKYTPKTEEKMAMLNGDTFVDTMVQTEPVGEVVGVVNVFTGKFISNIENIGLYSIDVGQLVALHNYMFPEEKEVEIKEESKAEVKSVVNKKKPRKKAKKQPNLRKKVKEVLNDLLKLI